MALYKFDFMFCYYVQGTRPHPLTKIGFCHGRNFRPCPKSVEYFGPYCRVPSFNTPTRTKYKVFSYLSVTESYLNEKMIERSQDCMCINSDIQIFLDLTYHPCPLSDCIYLY